MQGSPQRATTYIVGAAILGLLVFALAVFDESPPGGVNRHRPAGGASQAVAAIERKYVSYGGTAKLGHPRGPDYRVAGGSARDYDRGTIYYSDGTGAHVVLSDIAGYYQQKNGTSRFGFPIADEQQYYDGFRLQCGGPGRIEYDLFRKGDDRPHVVWGDIRAQYVSQGGPHPFSWPTADETDLHDRSGRLIGEELQLLAGPDPANRFVFYYGNSLGQAHWVHGGILAKYLEVGENRLCLGFPTSDQTENPDGTFQTTFEHGRIVYNGSNGSETATCLGKAPYPQPIVVDESGPTGDRSGFLSASPNGIYSYAQECSIPQAFSFHFYPPRNCAQLGAQYRDNFFWFTGNDNCVSERRPDSGSTFTWTVTIPITGQWHVDVYIPYWTQYNLGAVYVVDSDAGAQDSQVNQQDNAGLWVNILAASPFTAGRQYSVTLDGRDLYDHFCHYQAADKVRWTWDGGAPLVAGPPAQSLTVGPSTVWNPLAVGTYAASFEDGTSDNWINDGKENASIYCNGNGYGDGCFLETNDPEAQSRNIHQDVPLAPLQGHAYQLCMELSLAGAIPATVQLAVWEMGGTIPPQSAWQDAILTSSTWQQLCTVAYTPDSGHGGLHGELTLRTSNVKVDVDEVTWTEK
jgi:hypothetical protein